MFTFTAWELHCKSMSARLMELLAEQKISDSAEVWTGADGSGIVGREPNDAENEQTEYILAGNVSDYIQ